MTVTSKAVEPPLLLVTIVMDAASPASPAAGDTDFVTATFAETTVVSTTLPVDEPRLVETCDPFRSPIPAVLPASSRARATTSTKITLFVWSAGPTTTSPKRSDRSAPGVAPPDAVGATTVASGVVAASAPPKAEASTECETYCMRPRPGNWVASEMRAPRVSACDVPTGSCSR